MFLAQLLSKIEVGIFQNTMRNKTSKDRPERDKRSPPDAKGRVKKMLKVKDIMTINPLKVDAGQTVREAVRLMSEKKIGSIIVVKGDEIVGILEEGDIVKNVLCKDLNVYVTKIGEVMSVPFIINEENSDDEASEMMVKYRVRHLAVSSDSKIIGVVSMYDLMRPIYTGRSFWT